MGGAVQKRNETYLKAKQIYEHLISVSFETSESFKNNIIIEIWFSERMPWTHASIFIKSHTAPSAVLADYHTVLKDKDYLGYTLQAHQPLKQFTSQYQDLSSSTHPDFRMRNISSFSTKTEDRPNWEMMKQTFVQPTITPKPFDSQPAPVWSLKRFSQGGFLNTLISLSIMYSQHRVCKYISSKQWHHFMDSGVDRILAMV